MIAARMIWYRILVDGGLLSLAGAILIFGSLRFNPRLWLQDYPKDIQNRVAPKTPHERRASLAWGVPFLAMLVGMPALSCWVVKQQSGGSVPLGFLFLDAFGVAFLFNVFDLVVIDWLIVCAMTPAFVVIPGTEGAAGYQDYRHHLRAFGVGTIGSLLVAAVVSVLIWLV
jgi:hypothetical protein